MSEELTITLLEKSITVACPPGQAAALRESAELLNQQMLKVQAKKPTATLLNIALISALNISHELITHTSTQQASAQAVEKLCDAITQAL